MSQRGCQSLRSCSLQRIKTQVEIVVVIANESKQKAIKMNGVNYGGNMDRGPMTLTSDVSRPKDDKQLCWVNKLQLGN